MGCRQLKPHMRSNKAKLESNLLFKDKRAKVWAADEIAKRKDQDEDLREEPICE